MLKHVLKTLVALKTLLAAIFIICSSPILAATTQGTAFTYQGELLDNGLPVNGNYDVTVELYDASTAGLLVSSQAFSPVAVSSGIFSIQLDLGDVPFMGNQNWIELRVRPTGTSTFTPLLPRQLITNAPYAIQSQFVATDGVDALSITNNSILNRHLANQVVDTAELADFAVTSSKLGPGSVTAGKIAFASIDSADIQDGSLGSIDIDSDAIQRRVNASCPLGSSIRQIMSDGSVACETDDTGGSPGWGLTGNAGTTAGTNFIGTTDNIDLVLKVNNTQRASFDASNRNVNLGAASNTLNFEAFDSNISGGSTNTINVNSLSTHMSIGGGRGNSIITASGGGTSTSANIGGGTGNTAAREAATVSGGKNNQAIDTFSTVSGGLSNKATANSATVPGGSTNSAGGDYSFAAGRSATVRDAQAVGNGDTDGDENTFIWSSENTFFTSTGPKQFLVQAAGGFGIGTNQPASPFHLVGTGTSTGSTPGSNEVLMTLEPENGNADIAIVLNKLTASADSSLIFSQNGQIQYDIRDNGGSGLQFSSYDNSNIQTLIMRLINTSSQTRADFSADLEPQLNDVFNLGASSFRWKNIYSINPVDVSSDKRLKDNIENLDYGLAEILAMRPVSYYWKKGDTEQLHLGLIAQEVENIVPEIVTKSQDAKAMRSMRYTELVPVLIKATQEQQVIIDQQSQQIKSLTRMLQTLMDTKNGHQE